MIWIIAGILLFLFLVLIHELGHFVAAKKTGVQVLEFGMGIPPKLGTMWTDKSGTEYTLNAIPLWGFVRLKGEDPSDPGTFKAKDSFIMASFLSKTIILLAGVTVNFIFAWFVLTMLFWKGVSPLMVVPTNATTAHIESYLTPNIDFLMKKWYVDETQADVLTIQKIVPDSIAAQIGLREWDRIVRIDQIPITSLNLQSTLQWLVDTTFEMEILRGEKSLVLSTQCPADNCMLWVGIEPIVSMQDLRFQFGLWQAALVSLQELYTQWRLTLNKLWSLWWSLLPGTSSSAKQELQWLSWPIWAVKFGDMLLQQGMWDQFMIFGALISFALAIFNLLPIPALDGGRRLWVIIQTLFFRNKVEQYFVIESYINFVFFVLLMVLWVYIMLKDLVVARGVYIPFIG